MDTLADEDGADAYDHALGHADSRYYTINDYYNMSSDGSLHILSHFETYQQTTEYSFGCAAALMVLNHYGNTAYNELEICRIAETDTSKGSSVEGLASFFESIGWETEAPAGLHALGRQTVTKCQMTRPQAADIQRLGARPISVLCLACAIHTDADTNT